MDENNLRLAEDLVGPDGRTQMPTQEAGPKVDRKQLLEWNRKLQEYKTGKAWLESRVVQAEQWWKLRNSSMNARVSQKREGYSSSSAWLHNVIVSKHADAMEAYPEPNILPREAGDQQEARSLSSIIPCVLEQNGFEGVYSDAMWRKLKTGTGVYKVVWDPTKMGGLGDISIMSCDLLNVFWEPGVDDIQDSELFFTTKLESMKLLEERYPQLKGKWKRSAFQATRFLYDDTVPLADKTTVIEIYYHRWQGERKVLHYCKYVGDEVLYATEDMPQLQGRGLYDHGLFPFVFDPLFPVEGSPCGYGFVDLCHNPQTAIDLMRTAVVRNTVAGATPRYFERTDGAINEEEFADLTQEIVHVNGPLDEAAGHIRVVDYKPLSGNHIQAMEAVVQELRETSGNTDTATGSTAAGVTAASAIAALQEASGKGSRDSSRGSYRAYAKVVSLSIELVRQFYDMPRQFRITGTGGQQTFISYSNAGIRPQAQGTDFGVDMGYRMPVFDIKIEPQKRNVYTRLTQNELALQLYGAGMFVPQNAEPALICLEMMEFEGKDSLLQKIQANATMFQQLQAAVQAAMALAQRYEPQNVPMLAAQLGIAGPQMGAMPPRSGAQAAPPEANVNEDGQREHGLVTKARERAARASQPEG